MLPENVILMNVDSVYTKISVYLTEVGNSSKRTQEEYSKDITQFFQLMRGKSLEQLTVKDLKFSATEMVNYKNTLTEHYAGTSVNRKLSTIRSLMTQLAKDYEDTINLAVFEVKRAKEDVNSYGTLTWDEVEKMIELALEFKDQPLEKSIMLELAGRTSIRLSALLNLTWDNINPMDDFYIVEVYDKGHKLDTKPIPASLYEKMKELKANNPVNVFSLTERTCQRMIKSLCDKMGIDASPEGRNITFHSLKKMGVEYVLERTGDIMEGALQGNHSNIQTTYKHYAEMTKRKKIPNMAGLQMGKELDMSVFENMTKEDILKVIGRMDEGFKARLVLEANKTGSYRNQ